MMFAVLLAKYFIAPLQYIFVGLSGFERGIRSFFVPCVYVVGRLSMQNAIVYFTFYQTFQLSTEVVHHTVVGSHRQTVCNTFGLEA